MHINLFDIQTEVKHSNYNNIWCFLTLNPISTLNFFNLYMKVLFYFIKINSNFLLKPM